MTEETTNSEMSQEEQMKAIIEQLKQTIDARDFMTPTQREIANLTMEQLEQEYQEVLAKQSKRGRAQRDYIITRYEFEQQKNEQASADNTDNAEGAK